MLTKRQENKLDKGIELLYKKYAAGRQINIMKIGVLYRDAKKDHLAGLDLEIAVKNAIARHCEPVDNI